MRNASLPLERQQDYPASRVPTVQRQSQPPLTASGDMIQPGSRPVGRISRRTFRLAQLALVLGIAATIGLAYVLHPGVRAEMGCAMAVLASGDGAAIGDYLLSFGVWAPLASLFLMVVQAVAAPIPAILVAFANGLTFGVFWGGLLTVAGQTLAAIVCFGIARALGRGPVEALSGRLGLEAADRWFTRWGARGIIVLRLVPGISFDVISYGAGLTGIGWRSFVAATAIGVAPQAFLYAYLILEAPRTAWIFYAASWGVVAIVGLAAIVRSKRHGQRADLPESRAEPTRHGPSPLPAGCPSGAD